MVIIAEPEPIEVLKHPYPYEAAFTVASDIDSASARRFRAIHALFCGHGLIKEGSAEWCALGLTVNCPRFDRGQGGIAGLGLDFSDSFFLVGDATTFGMYRYAAQKGCFLEDEQDGENCATLVRRWLKEGKVDSFHAFLHYTRREVEPLLKGFYSWCDREGVPKPKVSTNHSAPVTPSGLCPDHLQPSRSHRLARLAARAVIGPVFGRKRLPLNYAFVRYQGDTKNSAYYVNDLLAENGLRYVWLNAGDDLRCNQVVLPEWQQNGRFSILRPVKMDDGVRYYRFERCYGRPARRRGEAYLRDSEEGVDASHLITERNLTELCNLKGTCILYTHWTHYRSTPIADETIQRFELLQHWRDTGRIWTPRLAQLLEWTRRRAFLCINCHREADGLVIDIGAVDDPIFGRERMELRDLHGLTFRLRRPEANLTIALNGKQLTPDEVGRCGTTCWLQAGQPDN